MTFTIKTLGLAATALVVLQGCSTLGGGEADERWADYKSWQKVTSLAPTTGDPTGFLGGLHRGNEGYREVYVNDIGAEALLGSAPYNLPAGTVIVKEQYANKADWEAGEDVQHTISIKTTAGDTLDKANWQWAESFTDTAGPSAFCSGCHTIAARNDYVFTNGEHLKVN